MFTKFRTNEKGFTLIELLIVVAIIGILAAIAIPQFSQYRIRGYNSAASSDLRNLKVAEEAYKTDWQVYVSTDSCGALASVAANVAACTGAAGPGLNITGPGNVAFPIAAAGIVGVYPTADTTFSYGLSSGVASGISTDAAGGTSYTIVTAHTQGDLVYGADSDNTQVKMAGKNALGAIVALTAKAAGTLLAGTAPVSVAGTDQFAAAPWVNM